MHFQKISNILSAPIKRVNYQAHIARWLNWASLFPEPIYRFQWRVMKSTSFQFNLQWTKAICKSKRGNFSTRRKMCEAAEQNCLEPSPTQHRQRCCWREGEGINEYWIQKVPQPFQSKIPSPPQSTVDKITKNYLFSFSNRTHKRNSFLGLRLKLFFLRLN